jgi:hypothetical protein
MITTDSTRVGTLEKRLKGRRKGGKTRRGEKRRGKGKQISWGNLCKTNTQIKFWMIIWVFSTML